MCDRYCVKNTSLLSAGLTKSPPCHASTAYCIQNLELAHQKFRVVEPEPKARAVKSGFEEQGAKQKTTGAAG